MIDDASVSQWLDAVSRALKEQIIPALDDDYLKEQAVAAYVLSRMAQRYVSNMDGGSPREHITAAFMREGAAAAVACLGPSAGLGLGEAGDPDTGDASTLQSATRQTSAVVEALWAARDELTEDEFRAARSALHASWRRALEYDQVVYGRKPAAS
ncbi:hypothetical protein [Acrocarpospora catenulata]|uniref:hypothetical protein n=1 Tax=Acrocarpospora catenulata TaxID=2836182 RepID=UPI001BDABFEB|nr:hypothetical protein [Acrocarpospora catenulata]